MKTRLLSFLLLLSLPVFSQDFTEKKVESEVEKVTIYLSGAQVFREAETRLSTGNYELTIPGLSPYLDEKTLQIKAEGQITILSVNRNINYLDEVQKSERADSIIQAMEAIDTQNENDDVRLAVLSEKRNLLQENRKLRTENTDLSLTQLQEALTFYDREMSRLLEERLDLNRQKKERTKTKEKLQRQLVSLKEVKTEPTGEVIIRLRADATGTVRLGISYLVDNVGWFPKYDVRVADVESPFRLDYKAEVFQNTKEDWEQVNLSFSTTNPDQSGLAPTLEKWYLNFARYTSIQPRPYGPGATAKPGTVAGRITDENGEPVIGASIYVEGSSAGTVTDMDGNYELLIPKGAREIIVSYTGYESQRMPVAGGSVRNIQLYSSDAMLEEVVVSGYGQTNSKIQADRASMPPPPPAPKPTTIRTTLTEKETDLIFTVDEPYTLRSGAEKRMIDLQQYEVPAQYTYVTIPKLESAAFLTAQFTDWDQYGLLEGEANLFFEEAFVGKTILEVSALQDTLGLSLGRDRNISVDRKVDETFAKKRSIGSNMVETRGIRITIRNNKSQTVAVKLQDQIPVTAINEITVSTEELSGGTLDEETGEVTWNLSLKPQETREIVLRYEVKYPKKERVILE